MSASPWPHFSVEELSCSHCGKMEMDDAFMWKMVGLRKRVGTIFVVTSAYRCEEYDKKFGGKGNHQGHAIDFAISLAPAWKVVELAFAYGFTGLGLKQHGPFPKRYIHLDDTHVVNTMWTYE